MTTENITFVLILLLHCRQNSQEHSRNNISQMIFSQIKRIYSFILTTPSKAIAGILVNGVKEWNKENICWFPEKIKETLYLPLQVHFCESFLFVFTNWDKIIFCGMNLTLNIPFNWFKKCSFIHFTDFWLVASRFCVKRGSAEKDHLGAIG